MERGANVRGDLHGCEGGTSNTNTRGRWVWPPIMTAPPTIAMSHCLWGEKGADVRGVPYIVILCLESTRIHLDSLDSLESRESDWNKWGTVKH